MRNRDLSGGVSASERTPGLGARLRHARLAQRRTLAEVAGASGLTKGFVSKLENDQANASVASLMRLCETLEVPVGSLFDPAAGSVVRASDYRSIEFGGERMHEFVLTPRTERRLQALVSEIEPGGGSGADPYTLPTDVEFAFVLDGCLEISLAGPTDTREATVVLGRGDAFTFPAESRHRFRAIADDRPTRVLWVFSPALSTRGRAAAAPDTTEPDEDE
ncbi:MAG: helix-turn-helix domain-containing protein [Nocardioidaceae bacterium]